MTEPLYPAPSRELSAKRRALAPETERAFQAFSRQAFADGALSGYRWGPERKRAILTREKQAKF